MRRDVRLLGDMLGEVLRESERPGSARRRGAAAAGGDRGAGQPRLRPPTAWRTRTRTRPGTRSRRWWPAGRWIAPSWWPGRSPSTSTSPTWPRSSSGSARCGSATPAQAPVRESLAAAVAGVPPGAGPGHLDDLLARLRVHPVLTAHPTEARRRAVATALRRISVLLDAPGRRPARRRRAGGDPAPAARGDRPAVADVAAAGQGHGADRRGPHRHGRVRRDPVPRGARAVPGARRGPPRGRRPARAPPRGPRRSCATAAGSAPTGTATRSSPPR